MFSKIGFLICLLAVGIIVQPPPVAAARQTANMDTPKLQMETNTTTTQDDLACEPTVDSPPSDSTPSIPSTSVETTEKKTLAEIEQQRSVIGADEQMDEVQKNGRLEILATAQNALLKASTYRLKKGEYEYQLTEYPKLLQELQQQQIAQPEPEPFTVTLTTSADSLSPKLRELEKEYQDKKKLMLDLEAENDVLNQRITEIPGVRASVTEELTKVDEFLATLSGGDEDLDAHLRWLLQNAKKILFESQLDMLDAENRRQEIAGKVLPMKRDQISRVIKRLEAQSSEYESTIAELRRSEVRRQAQEARMEAINAHPALNDIASRNQELTQLRSNITGRIQSANEELSKVDRVVEELVANLQNLENKIQAAGGVTRSNGMLLVERRRSLVSPFESQARIKEIQAELQNVNVAVLTLEEERKSLADPAEFIEQQLGDVAQQMVGGEPLSAMGIKFIETKRQYLDDLIKDYNQYRGLLGKLEVSRDRLVDQIGDIRSYIDQKALWVRNTDPVTVNDLTESAEALKSFFAADRWGEMASQLTHRVRSKPYEAALGMSGIFIMFVFTRRLKRQIDHK